MGESLDENSIDQDHQERRAFYRDIGGLLGLALAPVLFGYVFLPFYLEKHLCPLSTFHNGLMAKGTELLFGILGGLISLVIFFSCVLSKYIAKKSYPVVVLVAALSFLATGAVYVDSVEYYYCTTPTNIVFRSGVLDTPHFFTWDDVSEVRAGCSIYTARGQYPHQDSTLDLILKDGQKVPFGLINGRQILFRDYSMLRKALENKNYAYSKDATVNPSLCPAELYPLLQDWAQFPAASHEQAGAVH